MKVGHQLRGFSGATLLLEIERAMRTGSIPSCLDWPALIIPFHWAIGAAVINTVIIACRNLLFQDLEPLHNLDDGQCLAVFATNEQGLQGDEKEEKIRNPTISDQGSS